MVGLFLTMTSSFCEHFIREMNLFMWLEAEAEVA